MKKKTKILLCALCLFLLCTQAVFADEAAHEAVNESLPLWSMIPFACMLLSIAVFPLVKPEWWEKNMLKVIEKAIQISDLGINPTNDGSTIRLVFPELTEERRKELAKDVKKKGEAAKVAIRNIRRDGNDAFKKLKGSDISEDGIKDLEDKLQKLTDKYIKEVDKEVEAKTKEVMTV